MAALTSTIVVSQRHLSLLETCPRRYQAEVLDRRALPMDSNRRQALQRGQQFHHLLQQRALGLEIRGHDPQLDRWLAKLEDSGAWNMSDPSQCYRAEHTRILSLPPFELLVRYDALVANANRADIIDWKTYSRPQQTQNLETNWQTRLYRYVLAATSDYPHDRIAMVYWFTESRSGEASNSVRLPYSKAQFDRDRDEIAGLLARLERYLGDCYFPTRSDLGNDCTPQHCLCRQLDADTSSRISASDIPKLTIEEIPEVPIELG